MGRASGIRIMGWGSKLLHGGKHRSNGIGVGHLAGHLFLPLSQKIRSPLLIILIPVHNALNACQNRLSDVRSSHSKKKA
jgi:hypothetical protein